VHRIYQPQPGWQAFGGKLALALLVMTAVLWAGMGSESWWLSAAWHLRTAGLLGMVLLGAGSYFASLWLLGFRVQDFARRAAD
jgi:putative peptidoglycan lipid II flippase